MLRNRATCPSHIVWHIGSILLESLYETRIDFLLNNNWLNFYSLLKVFSVPFDLTITLPFCLSLPLSLSHTLSKTSINISLWLELSLMKNLNPEKFSLFPFPQFESCCKLEKKHRLVLYIGNSFFQTLVLPSSRSDLLCCCINVHIPLLLIHIGVCNVNFTSFLTNKRCCWISSLNLNLHLNNDC